MFVKSLILVILILFLGCNNRPAPAAVPSILKSNRNDSLYVLVGKKHDEVMPKDNDIERLIANLRKQEWQAPQKDTALTLLGKLNEAHDIMMDWMHEFKSTDLFEEDYNKMQEAQIWDYLLQEETRITTVAEKMLSSIEQSATFLAKQKK